ncbi:MAG: phosphoglucosamine mutase [Deltaproteobacteria bacterium]|nr:phosphoglucosamine mutase [Deltaproteobacteria bacterium]
MSDQLLFGTDGIRGKANRGAMTPEMAMRVGQALVLYGQRKKGVAVPKVVIGRDTRISGPMLEMALVSGICSMGGQAYFAGVLPTPAISYLTTVRGADFGVVISASHNPFEDNGIKIFGADGEKLGEAEEGWISQWVLSGKIKEGERLTGAVIGLSQKYPSAARRYQHFLLKFFRNSFHLKGMRILLDCANGAAYQVGPKLLERLGADLIVMGADPDGQNINEQCGSLHIERLAQKVAAEKADLGIALDGDGDRSLFVDERGHCLTGDHILAMMALDLDASRRLSNRTVVATVMSNFGFDIAMKEAGIGVVRVGVGDTQVRNEMRRGGHVLGGEQSGHTIFAEHSLNGDGLYTLLRVAELMKRRDQSLSQLASVIEPVPQVLENVPVVERRELNQICRLPELIRSVESELRGKGRVLVRYSGTELLARVMIEGENFSQIDRMAKEIANCIRQEVGGQRLS